MGGDWIPWVEGPVSTTLGFVLSSLSRGYRERRAQLLAEQTREKATRNAEEEAWRQEIRAALGQLRDESASFRDKIAGLEGAQGVILNSLGKETTQHP